MSKALRTLNALGLSRSAGENLPGLEHLCFFMLVTSVSENDVVSMPPDVHLGGAEGILPLPSNRKVTLNRPYAQKMPFKGLK